MIFKELDPFRGSPDDVAARIDADRMAYALRHLYRRSRDVDVLNGLRVGQGAGVAQIDHLLLHGHGLLIVERVPVAARVQIDHEGQWTIWHDGSPCRAPSPITGAYVQALMLKALLDRRVHQRGYFDQLELDVLVVVDDACEIEWPASGPLVEVCRRDDVVARVAQRIAQCQGNTARPPPLTESERRILADFLCRAHVPGSPMTQDRA